MTSLHPRRYLPITIPNLVLQLGVKELVTIARVAGRRAGYLYKIETRPRTKGNKVDSLLYRPTSSADLLYSALTRFDKRVAFVDGDRRLTYMQCARAVQDLREEMRQRGIRKGDATALIGGNHPETFFARAASSMEGARVTPLHAENGIDDHVYALSLTETDLLLYESPRFDGMASNVAEKLPNLRLMPFSRVSSYQNESDTTTTLEPPVHTEPEDIERIGFSGGTTGKPKGIIHLNRTTVTSTIYSIVEWEWPSELRFLVATPLSHATGAMVCPILLQGGTLVMMDRFSPENFGHLVERERITATFLVPTMLYRLLDSAETQDSKLQSLETVIYGASKIIPTRLKEAIERFGQIFLQLYGQAEAPNLVSVLRKSEHDPSDLNRLESCGRPLSCSTVKLLDSNDVEVPTGSVGEICVRGPLVMGGYWKQPELTEEVFSSGWLHTGDLARFGQDGYLTIVGRKKDMVITGGLNVYPAEVEAVLYEHPEVSAAAVIGVPDSDWGEKLVAFVVPSTFKGKVREEGGLESELMQFVKSKKGSVQTPKSVEIIEQLPLTLLGKPDKSILSQRFATLARGK